MSAEGRSLEPAGVCFDDLGPRRVMHYYDPRESLRAVVVIDTIRDWPSGGGVRLAPDLTLAEIARLARAMTYKYALLGMPIGGAKAGIWLDASHPSRGDVVRAFVRAIRPLLDAAAFVPGPDMGTHATDFPSIVPGVGGEASTLDERLTGYGVVVAARVARELRGESLAGSRVAIEGFGKVGRAAARYFVEAGARVVAVSTVRGAIHDAGGIDVEAAIRLCEANGDAGLERLPGAHVLPCSALFELDADVLVPGARPDVIHAGNVGSLRARTIIPGSNAPYAEGTLAALASRGIVAVPDFVSNAGGVLATIAALQGATGDAALALVRDAIERNVRRVSQRAHESKSTLSDAAIAIAREQLLAGAATVRGAAETVRGEA